MGAGAGLARTSEVVATRAERSVTDFILRKRRLLGFAEAEEEV